ncbi:glycine cleavage system aminomethyltransferase GcvT [Blastopirellula sp. J2-11]|uniref:glycine cleavage system aminomethyltransferase GcvT n=1 Tax=Blastopirellula sp. J2-11 TaxID=2943192 RepID=UPI0021C662BF|nr:glycine cleavage system aminomethyltransferase GcvT [Blastopirellula sp. J2-11]UUO07542.1 glycine cleavage system aminomethyltransferase GcvT [Blastopirellula sp. J2-11]
MTLAKTPLYDWHHAAGGRLVDFGGWSMPVQYSSIIDEHNATRTAVGMFDVSHMARFRFDGPGAGDFLDKLLTRKASVVPMGKIRYSLVCNDEGGILDDVLIYNLGEGDNQYFWLVVNAGNRQKIAAWIEQHLPDEGVVFTDHTHETAMIAVQGPKAIEAVQPLCDVPIHDLKYYSGALGTLCGEPALISRTGYTGEDGVEVTVPAAAAIAIWDQILNAAKPLGGLPCGLGARDTLRLEAAMPLYGHELSESIDPITAGLKFGVSFDHDFIGKDRLEAARDAAPPMVRVGFRCADRRVPREHCTVHIGDQQVGEVTSGTFSPTLNQPIAMGYVDPAIAVSGTAVEIDIRGKRVTAEVAPLPFYSRPRT